MRHIIILIAGIILSLGVRGQQIHITSVLDGNKGQLAVDSSTTVLDTLFYNPGYNNVLEKPYYVKNVITFRVDENATRSIGDFSDTLTVGISYRTASGALDSTTASFVLNYNPDSIYTSRMSYVFSGAYYVKVKILSISGSAALRKLLILENDMIPYRRFKFDCDLGMSSPLSVLNATADELTVGWPNVISTDEADLEWTFVDSSAIVRYIRSGGQWDADLLFNNNATRVTLAAYSYSIPLLYPGTGAVFVRIRPVQYREGKRITGKWSSDMANGILRYNIIGGHERGINWQSSISFAEEGKRKAVVQYYDGSLRQRQTVTKDNTTNTTVVAETMYDYQGRPAIQVMPAPTLNTVIQYSRNFNVGLNQAEYDKTKYDILSGTGFCNQHAAEMDSTSGASAYYSSVMQPQINVRNDKYIPDAYNYPFTETEYTADNTGRIKRQSGVGPSFTLGSGHETKYYYAITPDQNELDALFGTEVGDRNHYFKNAVQDANGQMSVSYTDMHGRTIATALAGDSTITPSLTGLKTNIPSTITETIADAATNVTKGVVMESHKSLLVTKGSLHNFHYTLNPQALSLPGCNQSAICYDCLYDLTITITDDCNNEHLGGKPYIIQVRNFKLDSIVNDCTPQGVDTSFSLFLETGNYEITKTLSLSQDGQNYYRDSVFIPGNTCKTLADFINEQRALLPQAGDCNITCASCLASIGSYNDFKNNYIQAVLGGQDSAAYINEIHDAYNDAVASCNEYCGIATAAANSIRDAMLLDMTPSGGQYANPADIDQYSIFSTNTYGQPLYQARSGYRDEQGKADTIFDRFNSTYKLPQQLSQAEFISNFKSSWAETLLPLHPEYCKLTDYENNLGSYNWDTRARAAEGYSEAIAKGFADPFNSPEKDPLTNNGTYYTPLYNAYTHYKDVKLEVNGDTITYPLSMWEFAKLMVLCPTNDSACLGTFLEGNQRTLYCAGDSNMAWNNFKQLYIGKKTELLNAHYYALSCPATAQQLTDAGHRLNFITYDAATAQNPLFDNDYTSTDPTVIKNQAREDLRDAYTETCRAYRKVWAQQLLPGYTAGDISEINARLVAVCVLGSDQDHPLGSRDVPAESPGFIDGPNVYRSFDDVINTYNAAHGYSRDLQHTADELTLPLPYYNNISVEKPVTTMPGVSECEKINAYHQQYTVYRTSPAESFSAYLERTTGTVITDSELEALLNSCSAPEAGCHFLSRPVKMPPIFQEKTGAACIGCGKMSELYYQYQTAYPGTAYEPKISGQEDSAQVKINTLFANFINNKTGLGLSASDYLGFMESCSNPADSFQNIINDFNASRFKVTAPYPIAAGKYPLVFSDGVAHIPESLEQPFSHHNWDAGTGFAKMDTLCVDDNFILETRVKEPKSSRGVPSYDVIVGFKADSVSLELNFVQPADTSSHQPSLMMIIPGDTTGISAAGYTLTDRGTTYRVNYDPAFVRNITGWTKVTIQSSFYSFKIYVNDTLIKTIPYTGSIRKMTKIYGTFKGTDGYIDYFKVYNRDSILRYSEEFEDSYQSASNHPSGFRCSDGPYDCAYSFTKYYNQRNHTGYTFGQIDSLCFNATGHPLDVCSQAGREQMLCRQSAVSYPEVSIEPVNNCTDSTFFITSVGTERYRYYKDSLNNIFDSLYRQKCLQAYQYESFTVSHPVSEYHYTLYYYDQAGNLVQTIPPEAVKPNRNTAYLADVKVKRAAGNVLRPGHNLVLATRYLYNTLNQVVLQKTPDAGESSFFYDRLGRLALSQNAKQAPDSKYSYTTYDPLGRITEVGELTGGSPMNADVSKTPEQLTGWLEAATDSRTEITQTVYDIQNESFNQPPGIPVPLVQRNLRNRVSYTKVFNTVYDEYAAATYYSYDIHGNVDTLVQDYNNSDMETTDNQFKKMVYTYDLISGKVNSVAYQPSGQDPFTINADAFYHRYSYDAENRLVNVETSTDSLDWDNEAFYRYYRHGPLARQVIGQQRVQGLDYAYTLQGWLKGVNSTSPASKYDMGVDGQVTINIPNATVGRDVFGYALYYYGKNDYRAADIDAQPFADAGTPLGTAFKPLYNGNIAAMTEDLNSFTKPLTFNYRYDQLNRLVQMRAYRNSNTVVNNILQPVAVPDYSEDIEYDGNGNILKYKRYGNSTNPNLTNAQVMDSLTYNYYTGTNRLKSISDPVNATLFATDIDNQAADNYSYDAIGNMIQDKADIDAIEWTVYGKIKQIRKKDGTEISYTYDAAGNRISKTVANAPSGGNGQTWYVRDGSGNVMAVYTLNNPDVNWGNPTLTELGIYGSSRLGLYQPNYDMYNGSPEVTEMDNLGRVAYYTEFYRGKKLFELTNHLGNVMATVTDTKIPVAVAGNITYFKANVISAGEYAPFGMQLPGRTVSSASYRYGFNGQEKSTELNSDGNLYTAEYWEYDARINRRWNLDPIPKVWESPYATFSNNPIWFSDPNGSDTTSPNKVMIDPGHGDKYQGIKQVDPGAGAAGVNEKDITLNIGTAVNKYLTQFGVTNEMTRTDDKTDAGKRITWRIQAANDANADIFVSIHADAAGPDASGFHVIYQEGNTNSINSKNLATSIAGAQTIMNLRGTGVDKDVRNLGVLREFNKKASVLIETGYVTNEGDRTKLVSNADDIGKQIATGIYKFIYNGPPPTPNSQKSNSPQILAPSIGPVEIKRDGYIQAMHEQMLKKAPLIERKQ